MASARSRWSSVGRVAGLTGLMIAGLMGVEARAQQAPSFPSLPEDLRPGQGRTQPCLDQVEGEALCGRFRVYENRQSRVGRTIDLAFVILKALSGDSPSDAFTQFNGGPGASTTPGAFFMAQFRSDVREERDILLIDHRGTGNSAGLYCDNAFPGGIVSRFETVFPEDHVKACRDMLARRADLSEYTTPNAMDDLAELAAWLGYSELNLMGGSYGTREAQIFTRRHPELVRTVMLNGVAPVHEQLYVQHARDLQGALDNMMAECRSEAACSKAYPDLEVVLGDVLAKAESDPPRVTVEGTAVSFGIGPLSYALRGLLYNQAGAVPARLYEAHKGDWQALAEYYLGRQAWVGGAGGVPAGYHYSVLCAEDIDPLTWEEIEEETEGTFMGDFLIAGYKRTCDLWPSAEPGDSYFTPVASDKPVLLLSGAQDPVTPPEGGDLVADSWPNSVHVVVPNGGHGQGGPCISAMILELLRTASVEGIDVSCVQSSPPTQFEVVG